MTCSVFNDVTIDYREGTGINAQPRINAQPGEGQGLMHSQGRDRDS